MTQIVAMQDREEVLRHIQKVRESFHIKAPDLPEHFPWLNVDRPLTSRDLRGKVVLLDFWTYCCINCMHVLADLKYLETKYADRPFVVVGVHSAKFYHERDADHVRQAVLRHEIEHPVIVDQNFALWQAYTVHAWPTFVLIDPDGNIEAVFSGEGNREILDLYIDVLLEQCAKGDTPLNDAPLPIALEKNKPDPDRENAPLNYPGKILADPEHCRLYIADSRRHRILVADFNGKLLHTVGGSQPGFADGDFTTARFLGPQGLALYREKLLVADTENHAVRQIDFATRRVRTLAGTGGQGHYHQAAGYGPNIPLASPWDLTVVGEKCFIAMAGAHQIWTLDLEMLTIEPYAGTGQEARIDGPRKKSAFAQPSGITADADGKSLYVADSETSSVRRIDLERNGTVTTLVGGDLFDFGDEDGRGSAVRLQHPLGIHYLHGKLYLADTYNHKIKIIDPRSGQTRSYLGGGKPGRKDGLAPLFYEPGGLTSADGKLFVADTNNHAIRVVDLKTHQVHTLDLANPTVPLEKPVISVSRDQLLPVSRLVTEQPRAVSSDGFTLRVRIQLPEHRRLAPGTPVVYLLLGRQEAFDVPGLNVIQTLDKPREQFDVPVKFNHDRGRHQLRLQLHYFYCDEPPGGACRIQTVEHRIPFDITDTGSAELVVHETPE